MQPLLLKPSEPSFARREGKAQLLLDTTGQGEVTDGGNFDPGGSVKERMRALTGFVCVLMATALAGARSGSPVHETQGTCADGLTLPADAGIRLAVFARPAEVNFVGTDAREIRVTCKLDDADSASRVRIRYRGGDGKGELVIKGGPDNNVRITIEMPHQTHLHVRVPAGAVHIKDVAGDKDIDVHAGELTISGVNPGAYRSVDAEVEIGEVRAKEFSVDKGGFFRSFKRSSAEGLYRLDAHIITGSIQLN